MGVNDSRDTVILETWKAPKDEVEEVETPFSQTATPTWEAWKEEQEKQQEHVRACEEMHWKACASVSDRPGCESRCATLGMFPNCVSVPTSCINKWCKWKWIEGDRNECGKTTQGLPSLGGIGEIESVPSIYSPLPPNLLALSKLQICHWDDEIFLSWATSLISITLLSLPLSFK